MPSSLWDATGKYVPAGRYSKTFDWTPSTTGEALPSWLVDTAGATGTAPAVTGVDSTRGICTLVSGASNGNYAGVSTAFNIDTAEFEEIGFFVYSWSTNQATDTGQTTIMQLSDGATGMYLQTNATTLGNTQVRSYPSATIDTLAWEITKNSNAQRQKDFGVVIRPRTKEVYVFAGDPAEGAGCIWYQGDGRWNDIAGVPFFLRVYAQNGSGANTATFSRIKLRLSAN
jgi:hypothetical protein